MPKQKYYTVWQGAQTGVFDTWAACHRSVSGYPGAQFKAFASRQEAELAFSRPAEEYLSDRAIEGKAPTPPRPQAAVQSLPPEVEPNALAVDAACSGNPGRMEYRGVYLKTGKEVFHLGPIFGTNNIGEFLAIVHALALLEQKGVQMPIYSDSRNALLWVRARKCRTKLPQSPKSARAHELIARAEAWLKARPTLACPLKKWETERWGEVPADFGRK